MGVTESRAFVQEDLLRLFCKSSKPPATTILLFTIPVWSLCILLNAAFKKWDVSKKERKKEQWERVKKGKKLDREKKQEKVSTKERMNANMTLSNDNKVYSSKILSLLTHEPNKIDSCVLQCLLRFTTLSSRQESSEICVSSQILIFLRGAVHANHSSASNIKGPRHRLKSWPKPSAFSKGTMRPANSWDHPDSKTAWQVDFSTANAQKMTNNQGFAENSLCRASANLLSLQDRWIIYIYISEYMYICYIKYIHIYIL